MTIKYTHFLKLIALYRSNLWVCLNCFYSGSSGIICPSPCSKVMRGKYDFLQDLKDGRVKVMAETGLSYMTPPMSLPR